MNALLLVFALAVPAQSQKTTVDMPFLKVGVLNSNNNCFTAECCKKMLSTFDKKDIILMETSVDKIIETKIGSVVCLRQDANGWLMAKCVFDSSAPPPQGYVLRLHSKPVKYTVTDQISYNIEECAVQRFLLVSPVKASRFE